MAKNSKEQYLGWVKRYIKRDGIDDVIKFLEESDFFIAPASTRFHLSKPEGLCIHSMNVCKMLFKFAPAYFGTDYCNQPDVQETIAIVSLFHDICKANIYVPGTRNVKNEKTGKWEKVPSYDFDDQYPIGHGEKSVILLLKLGFKLTDEEMFAIRYHMGYGSEETKGGARGIYGAFRKYPMAHLTSMADDMATKEEERQEEKEKEEANA